MSIIYRGREYKTNGDTNVTFLAERDIRTVEVILRETVSRVIEVQIHADDDYDAAIGAVSELYEEGDICLDRQDDGVEYFTVELR